MRKHWSAAQRKMSREALRVVEGHPLSARFTAEGIVLGKGDSGPLSGGKARTIALHDPDCLQFGTGRYPALDCLT
ncbi:protein of unknown function [Nitrospira defluvii]|uniref:Uncharacterized protein n=1 Tax=Nitrospira defluvii TaxID=330214 RepID=D8PEZ1_9BACT|nr:protein of unknown function [Nitrospira defluvii]